MKKLFPIILLVLPAFCSCEKYNDLPNVEFPNYNAGDVYYYTSQSSGQKDTLYVVRKNINVEAETTKESGTKYYESGDYLFVNISTNVKFIIHESYGGFGEMSLEINGETIDMQKVDMVDVVVNKKKTKNVFLMSQNAVDTLNAPMLVYFSPKHGILKYVTADNDEYIVDK